MMYRHLLVCLVLVSLSSVAFAATTVILDGKAVTLPVIDAAGKAYVDVASLMKMLGGKATYDAAAGKLYINTAGATAAPSGGGAGAASGTAQLAGDNGVLGQVYTIRKREPLYFSLKSAEYTLDQVRLGDQTVTPTADEKLLVLHFTVQNPLKTEQYVRWDSLRFTAVDAHNVNHEAEYHWGDPANEAAISQDLKPAQTLPCYTVIKVPAKGEIPKLMVLPDADDDGPVLRYDLLAKVKALPAPMADPADETGATTIDPIPAQFGTACPIGEFDVTVEKIASTTEQLGEATPPEGGKFVLVTALLKNESTQEQYLSWDIVAPVLATADGEELSYTTMLGATSNREIGQELNPGKELRVRLVFEVPEGAVPATLSLKQEESHTFQFALPAQ
ncbi:MAG: DUF4352 domain-containing protein [Armatimonadota bacterium]